MLMKNFIIGIVCGLTIGIIAAILVEPYFAVVSAVDTGDGGVLTICDGGNFKVVVEPSYTKPRMAWSCKDDHEVFGLAPDAAHGLIQWNIIRNGDGPRNETSHRFMHRARNI
jgi:hypothetical protein